MYLTAKHKFALRFAKVKVYQINIDVPEEIFLEHFPLNPNNIGDYP